MATVKEGPIVITGCRGLLGRALVDAFGEAGIDVLGIDIDDVDIADAAAVDAYFERVKPALVINCAAYARVDACESNREECFRVNAAGAGNVARAAVATAARLIHMSTDYVFDGRVGRPYLEDDAPHPASAYGASKLAGEKEVLAAGGRYLIVRTAWLFGAGGPNFIATILGRARAGEPLRVVDDQYGSPTYAGHLAAALVRLAAADAGGVLHVAGGGVASWYDVAAAALELARIPVPLAAIKTSEYPTAAPRPPNSALACGKYKELVGTPMPPWREGVAAYLRDLGVIA
jgi:dTDP-4-dehydrorhamnose reductase